jgi:hypothetical protein
MHLLASILRTLESHGHRDRFDNFTEDGLGRFGFFLQRGVARTGNDAMCKNGHSKLFEIVRQAIIAAIEEGPGLCGALQHQSAARAHTESKLFGLARAIDDFEGVVVQAGVHLNVVDRFLHGEYLAQIRYRLERMERIIADAFAQDFPLGFVRRISHFDAHEKTVELRFRQRVRAVMLDGILRGHHKKRLWKKLCSAVHADLGFVHSLEERRLCAGRGAVDFVRENDVGENGAGAKFKFAVLGIVNADAEHVARKQIRSELNALEGAMKGFGERLRQRGLADAGNVFNEQVAAGKERDQRKLNGFFLAKDGARDGALQLGDDLRGGGWHVLKTGPLPVTNR